MTLKMKIRDSNEREVPEIEQVHIVAFGSDEGPEVGKLAVDLLSDPTAKPYLSLVAIESDNIIGHILFTKATLLGAEKPVKIQLLAPLAVVPDRQNSGVGLQLINEGLKRLKESNTELVFVLGHPGYYPKCGFTPAFKHGFEAPYPIGEEVADAWMVQELSGKYIGKVSGKIQCSDVLDHPEHWRD